MTLLSTEIDQKLEKIAEEKLDIDTLEQRWSGQNNLY
jgi:hypothetical protein